MHIYNLKQWEHTHDFNIDTAKAKMNTQIVILITFAMMVVEIVAGYAFGSMALLADGWHMGTHAAALGITLFAYIYAQRHAKDEKYTFGTGKVGVLAGYSSSIILAVVALMMISESIHRLIHPTAIRFNEALIVASVGFVVNAVCAFLLNIKSHGHDHNLKAAYLHVLADSITSLFAMAALFAGKQFGWIVLDAVFGIVGALIILIWAKSLLFDTANILLDGGIDKEVVIEIRTLIEKDSDNRVVDLHIWRLGAHHMSAIFSIVTHHPRPPDYYKELLKGVEELSHISVEVIECTDKPCI